MILHFEEVSYSYPGSAARALDGLNLTVDPGESVLVAGSSGSGKSTFCRASIGLVPHFHHGKFTGRVLVAGCDTRRHPVHELFRHAGLVFQNPDAQLFNQTVEAELTYGLESLGMRPSEIESRMAWASGLTKLDSLMDRPPQTLSGGEKQRLALASILTLRPRLLLLDEPFTHLDPEGTEELRRILRTMKSEGITLVLVEHRLHEVIQDADRLIVFHAGKAVAEGPPRQVLSGDISTYGLNLPSLIRLFRTFGLDETPFNADEAIEALKTRNLLEPFSSRLSREIPKLSGAPGEAASPIVEGENIWFNYEGRNVLRGVHLKLQKGECIALLGRNGAGKTTLIKHLNGLLKPQRGFLTVLGLDTRRNPVSKISRHVGLVWQNPNDQLFRPTVREEVLTAPKAFRSYDPAWCNQLFERFGLSSLLDRSPFSLSEGQKKRVSFAAALAVKPGLIVLDEPTAGQDESFRRELTGFITRLREEGCAIVLATHDLEFAAEHATRWLVLSDGQIVADGPPEEVMADAAVMTKAGLRPTQRFQLIQFIKQPGKDTP